MAGNNLSRNLGLQAAYECSLGGTTSDNVWRDIVGRTSFDDVHMVGIFGTAE